MPGYCPSSCPLLLLLLLSWLGTKSIMTGLVGAVAENSMLNQCPELRSQDHLDLKEMMGKWYVVEVVENRGDPRQPAQTTSSGSLVPSHFQIDVCPIVQLRLIEGARSGPPRISLYWEEQAGTLEYTFWISGSQSLSVWNSDIIQNGTLAEKPKYRQFVGTVHVMKAVAGHMVLTFCSRDIDGQKFTVLLGRDHKLLKTEIRSVHNLLSRRGLQLLSIRESCANGAAAVTAALSNCLPILAAAALLARLASRALGAL